MTLYKKIHIIKRYLRFIEKFSKKFTENRQKININFNATFNATPKKSCKKWSEIVRSVKVLKAGKVPKIACYKNL